MSMMFMELAMHQELNNLWASMNHPVTWEWAELAMKLRLTKRPTLLETILLSSTKANQTHQAENTSWTYLLALSETQLSLIWTAKMLEPNCTFLLTYNNGISAKITLTTLTHKKVPNGSMNSSRDNTESLSTQETPMVLFPHTEPSNGSMSSTGTLLQSGDHIPLTTKLLDILKKEMDLLSPQSMELVTWHPNGEDPKLITLSSTGSKTRLSETTSLFDIYHHYSYKTLSTYYQLFYTHIYIYEFDNFLFISICFLFVR